MMAQLTVRQATQRAAQAGRQMGISYLNRIARTQSERLGAEFVDLPGTSIGYWLIDEDKLLEFLASTTPRANRRKPKADGEA